MRKCAVMAILLLGLTLGAGAQGVPESAWEVRPLLVGTPAPIPEGLVDARGEAFDLGAAMAGEKTVLVFYGGHW